VTAALRLLRTHEAALEASGGSAFVRYDVPSPLEGDGFALGRALALPRRTRTRRLGLLVLGPPEDVDPLVDLFAHGFPRCAIEMPVDACPLDEFMTLDHRLEGGLVREKVLTTVLFTRPGFSGGIGN